MTDRRADLLAELARLRAENQDLRRLLTDIVEGQQTINWQAVCERWGLCFTARDIRSRIPEDPPAGLPVT